jgi:iron complex outermembrane receptor protein
MSGGKISISKSLNEETVIFGSLSKGYKQGGFNIGLGLAGDSLQDDLIYDPEFLINYDIGVNFSSIASDLNFSIVAFYSAREDQQVLISQQVDPSDPNTFSYLTKNAAEGRNFGIESSIDIGITESLSAFANIGLLKTEITNWKSRPDLEGRSQAHAPKTSISLGINYDLSSNSYLSLGLVGKDEFYYSDSHDNKSKSYYLFNGSYGYTYKKWTIDLWAKNIFNKYYSVRGFYFGNEAPNFEDTLYRRHGDPRHFGASIKFDF